ncbi:MAG TPA: hypothetical protein VL981_10330 [Candidatus Methylacidiphilales bacterium]|nr:hypothetical protein [Candidatus Methylacidiphilales bacterium]
MEKVQIVRYALMQIVTVIYGVWSCAVSVKLGKPLVEMGTPMSPIYWGASFYCDYGFSLFVIILVWAIFVSYHSFFSTEGIIDERWLTWSGMALFLALFILSSFLAFGAGAAATFTPTRPLTGSR